MGYAEAIEQQTSLLAFYRGPAGQRYLRGRMEENAQRFPNILDRVTLDDLQRRTIALFEDAEPFYVAAPIARLVVEAARTIPEATILMRDFPARRGFMLLEGGDLGIDGIVWGWHTLAGTRDPMYREMLTTQEALRRNIVAMNGTIRERNEKNRRLRVSWERAASLDPSFAPDPDIYVDVPEEVEPSPLRAIVEVGFLMKTRQWGPGMNIWLMDHANEGQRWAETETDGDSDEDRAARRQGQRFLLAICQFMRQRILTTANRPVANRAARKRLAKLIEHTPMVKVVQLRARDYQQRDESQGTGVEYTCQWLVRGHWHQYHTREGLQPRWVMPYVKGPSDKPLRVAEKVAYEVVR